MLDAAVSLGLDAHNPSDHHGCYGNWAVAQTHPQAEFWAQANLHRLGFRSYLPLTAVRIRDRVIPTLIRTALKPLWPGYVFVNHDNPDLWRPIREAPGVANVLRNGSRLQYAKRGALEAIQAGEEARKQPKDQIAVGSACSVLLGPLAGQSAVVLAVGRQTARIAVLLFGQLREATLPLAAIAGRE